MAQILVKDEMLRCPRCGNDDLIRHGIDRQKRARARCPQCKRVFIINYNPRCPECDGFTRKDGWQSGRQRYKCKECGLKFSDGETKQRKNKPQKLKNIMKNFPSLKPLFGEPMKIDSLIGVPCFGCPDLKNSCSPESCEKLTNYIMKEVKRLSIEELAEEIWQRFRNGELTHEQVQQELTAILPPEPEGIFKALEVEIQKRVNDRFSWQVKSQLSPDAYFSKRGQEEKNVCTTDNFIKFFEEVGQPSQQDIDSMPKLDDCDLEKYHIIIFRTLIGLTDEDLGNTPPCQNLHEYYKLTRQELCNRGLMRDLGDAFVEYCQNKGQIQQHKAQIQNARKTGSICVFCGSTNVRSYNKEQWKCYSCGKRFRKH
jgi:transposase-like protein